MNRLLSFFRDSHDQFYKSVLLLIALLFLVYCLPKQGKFKYEYKSLKGKPWSYESLIAPFDFPILKPAEEIQREKSALIKDNKPFIRIDSTVQHQKIQQLNNSLQKTQKLKQEAKTSKANSTENFDKLASIGSKALKDVFSKGILKPNAAFEGKSADFTVFLLRNNVSTEQTLRDFYDIQTAYRYLQANLSGLSEQERNTLLPILESCITHNAFYDDEFTRKSLEQTISELSESRGVILKDQIVISKGEIVSTEKLQWLESLEKEYESQLGNKSSNFYIVTGQFIVVGLCLLILFAFLILFRTDIFQDNAKVTLILLLLCITVGMAALCQRLELFNLFILPFCILPIIIRAFFDTRIALFVHLVTTLIISFIAPNMFEYLFIQLVGGIIAVFSIVNMRNRSQFFLAAINIFGAYSLSYLGLHLVQDGSLEGINRIAFAWLGISASLALFSYPLIFLFEKAFGLISDVSLMELSDTNNKLLRELSLKAPGTFQHSLQVANIAEEAIFSIGGNAALVRTGALYHDIGKMVLPMYFIENQVSGINPHEELGYEESASIIISHVIKGIEIAKKHNLPEQVIDFIRTHHGTTLTTYFFNSFRKQYPDEEVDVSLFQYPGPIPFSKETAVLMMSDSVEAASRSLKNYDSESIDNLVEHIIGEQIKQNQFMNANITFKDIITIKKILKKKLMSIYHVRVEYPR